MVRTGASRGSLLTSSGFCLIGLSGCFRVFRLTARHRNTWRWWFVVLNSRWWFLGFSQVRAVTAVRSTIRCFYVVRSLVTLFDHQCFTPHATFSHQAAVVSCAQHYLSEGFEIFCCTVIVPLLFLLTFNELRSFLSLFAGLRLQKLVCCWE